MIRNTKKYGKCEICGKRGELNYRLIYDTKENKLIIFKYLCKKCLNDYFGE